MVWQNIQSFPTWQSGEHQNQMFIPTFQRSSKYTYCTTSKSNRNQILFTVPWIQKKIKYEVGEDMSSFPQWQSEIFKISFFFSLKSRSTALPLALHEKKERTLVLFPAVGSQKQNRRYAWKKSKYPTF